MENLEVHGSEIHKTQKCVSYMHYQFAASDYMSTYILSYEKCVGNYGAGVRIFMVQGGMRKIGWFRMHTTTTWNTCYTYIHTTTTCALVHMLHTHTLLLQVHQYTHYIHAYFYYKYTGTYRYTTPLHTLLLILHWYTGTHSADTSNNEWSHCLFNISFKVN